MRAQTHNVKEHKVYYKTKEKQYMKATNQHKTLNIIRGKLNWGATPLVGYQVYYQNKPQNMKPQSKDTDDMQTQQRT